MEISERDLADTYKTMDLSELQALQKKGTLTSFATMVLERELQSRGDNGEDQDLAQLTSTNGTDEIGLNQQQLLDYYLPNVWFSFVLVGVAIVISHLYFVIAEAYWFVLGLVTFAIHIYWLVCVYKIHLTLWHATRFTYPMKPNHVLFFHFVPVFNLIWPFFWCPRLVRFLSTEKHMRIYQAALILIGPVSFLAANLTIGVWITVIEDGLNSGKSASEALSFFIDIGIGIAAIFLFAPLLVIRKAVIKYIHQHQGQA